MTTLVYEVHPELTHESKRLGVKITATDRDLDVFGRLYAFPRLDFDQLCRLLHVPDQNRRCFRRRLLALSRTGCIHTFRGALHRGADF